MKIDWYWIGHNFHRLNALFIFLVIFALSVPDINKTMDAYVYTKWIMLAQFVSYGFVFWLGWSSGKERQHEIHHEVMAELMEQAEKDKGNHEPSN